MKLGSGVKVEVRSGGFGLVELGLTRGCCRIRAPSFMHEYESELTRTLLECWMR